MAKFYSTGITFRLNQNCDEINITQPPHKMLIRYKLRAAWQPETARGKAAGDFFANELILSYNVKGILFKEINMTKTQKMYKLH